MARRRRFLKYVGAATVGLAGCYDTGRDRSDPAGLTPGGGTSDGTPPARSTETPSPPPGLVERFETVRDVEEAGVDSSGESVVDDDLAALADDDTLLYFPEGTYRISHLEFRDRSNFGLYGDGATLVVDTRGRHSFLNFRRVSDVHIEGFGVDNTASNTAAWCDFKCVGGTNTIRNYSVDGFVDVNERTNGFTLMVEGGDTSLTVENVDLSRGGINAAAVFVFPRLEFYDPDRDPGSLTFRNCVMNGWGKEGLYASAHSGPLRVLGGRYANNAIAQVRVGGGNAPTRTVVRDVDVEVSSIPDYMPEGNRLLRGIWLKEGDGALVENCTVDVRNVEPNQTQGGIIVNQQFGRATIRNCDLSVDVGQPAITIDAPAEEYERSRMRSLTSLPDGWGVECTDVSIEGGSEISEAIRAAGRGGCTFTNVTVETGGRESDGIRLDGMSSFRVEDCSISVGRFPLTVRGLAEADSCAYRLARSSLVGNELSSDGTRVAEVGDGVFCLDQSTFEGAPGTASGSFALTRTEGPADGGPESGGTTGELAGGDGRWVLYGRWLEGS